MNRTFIVALASTCVIFAASHFTLAAPVALVIDQDQSQLNLTADGSVFGESLNVAEQHANAPTEYLGTIVANFPQGPLPGGSISFPGGSQAEADVMRGFFNFPLGTSPEIGGTAGNDPANYGIVLNAPIGIDLPELPLPDPIGSIDLGVLDSVQLDVALRDVVWDITSGPADSEKAIGAGGLFDATGGVGSGIQLGLSSGFADINGALVFSQDNIGSYLATLAALNLAVNLVPELNLTVDPNPDGNLLTTEVGLGIGARLDLTDIAGVVTLPNTEATPGTFTHGGLGDSELILPVDIALPDLGIPMDLLDLDLSFSGQLVATGVVPVPEPTSFTLVFIGAAWLLTARTRRGRA